jgi:hypothetical protein
MIPCARTVQLSTFAQQAPTILSNAHLATTVQVGQHPVLAHHAQPAPIPGQSQSVLPPNAWLALLGTIAHLPQPSPCYARQAPTMR